MLAETDRVLLYPTLPPNVAQALETGELPRFDADFFRGSIEDYPSHMLVIDLSTALEAGALDLPLQNPR